MHHRVVPGSSFASAPLGVLVFAANGWKEPSFLSNAAAHRQPVASNGPVVCPRHARLTADDPERVAPARRAKLPEDTLEAGRSGKATRRNLKAAQLTSVAAVRQQNGTASPADLTLAFFGRERRGRLRSDGVMRTARGLVVLAELTRAGHTHRRLPRRGSQHLTGTEQ